MTLLANRYEVLQELGRGSQGVVYRVTDRLSPSGSLALKRIDPGTSRGDEQRLRFKEEFRAMARLGHPNTLAVYDYGLLGDGAPYMTMELVEGRELTQVLAEEGPQPFERVAAWLVGVLQALGFIHARFYVHRDVKSSNVRLREDGSVKLMDFGLMHQLGASAGAEGGISGTPGYMAPEVIQGGALTTGVDLYAVGCLAYELIAGVLPFVGRVPAVLRAQIAEEPKPLASHRADTPDALAAIVSKLLAKDPRDRYASAAAAIDDLCAFTGQSVPAAPQAHRASYLVTGSLVGRRAELDDLMAALEAAERGTPGSVLVGAPAGVGKSRLVHELLLHARLEGATVLQGHCLERGMAAYEPLVQVLRPLVALSDAGELARFGPALARILPELALTGTAPLPALEPDPERRRVDAAVAGWLGALARRMTLVVSLDDLHWSDPRTLGVLNHAVRTLVGEPGVRLLVLGTCRTDETPASSPVRFTVAEGLTRLMTLAPFSPAQVEALLAAMLDRVVMTNDFARAFHETTRGNPFFVTEVVRGLMEDDALTLVDGAWRFPADAAALALPPTVQEAVLRRFEHLDPGPRALARAASVIGRYQTRDALLATSGLDEEGMFGALDELVARQFLLHEGGRYTFPHDRVREALYAAMPEAERRGFHQRCGEFLETRHDPGLLEDLANHFSAGLDARKAYGYLRKAGDAEMAAGVTMSALATWVRADAVLGSLDFPGRETEQAALWWDIGFLGFELWPAVAISALERLSALLEAQAPSDRICGALRRVGAVVNRLPEGLRERILTKLTAPVPYHHRPKGWLPPNVSAWLPRLLEAQCLLSAAHAFAGDPARGLEIADRTLARLPFLGTPLEGASLVVRCSSLYFAGRYDELVETAKRAEALLYRRPLPDSARVPLTACVGATAYQNGVSYQGVRPDEPLRDAAIGAATRIGATNLFNMIRHNFGLWAAWTGRPADAEAYIDDAVRHARAIGAPTYEWVHYLRAYLALQSGEVATARAFIDEALAQPRLDHAHFTREFLHALDGEIRLAEGDMAGAEAVFEGVEAKGRAGRVELMTMQGLLGRGRVALARADLGTARAALAEAHALAASGPSRNPLHAAIAARLLGTVDAREGRDADAASRFAEALAIVRRPEQDNLREEAHLLRASGELSLRAGHGPAARTSLAEAMRRYNQIEMPAAAAETAVLLADAERLLGTSKRAPTGLLARMPWQVTTAMHLPE